MIETRKINSNSNKKTDFTLRKGSFFKEGSTKSNINESTRDLIHYSNFNEN